MKQEYPGSWRAVIIRAHIKELLSDGSRVATFTLEDAVEWCYPARVKRPRWVGRSMASTLRDMIAKSKPTAHLSRSSAVGRGHKAVYQAKGRWT